MILAYWGRWVSLEELRDACGVSRDGSKAVNIVKAARAYGLEGAGMRRELEDMDRIALPCILHWGFNHFVVLEGLSRGGARINDPEHGRKKVRIEDFDKMFTGMALIFSPGENFRKSGDRSSLLSSLYRRIYAAKPEVLFALLVSFALIVPAIIVPAYMRVFVDEYLIAGRSDWLRPTLFAFGITIVVQTLLIWLQQRQFWRFEIKLTNESSQSFLWHMLNVPIEFFLQRMPGDLVSRVDGNQRVAQVIAGDLVSSTAGLLSVVLFSAVMLTYDVGLAVLAVALGLLNFLAAGLIWEHLQQLARRSLQNQSRLAATSVKGIADIEAIKANNTEEAFFSYWAAQQSEFITLNQRFSLATLALTTVPGLVAGVGNALIIGVGALHVMQGALTIGELVAFQALVIGFNAPITQFISLGAKLQQTTADLGRLDDVIRASQVQTEPERATQPSARAEGSSETRRGNVKLSGHVEFHDISFGYAKLDAPLIEGFELTLRPGTRVGIVGQTGSGKSTIARIAAGLYQPWSGEVRYDGSPIHAVDPKVLAAGMAFVDQEIHLFSGSVRDNVALWDDAVDDHAIVVAARDACLHEVVSVREGGYLSRVSERGQNFSSGERQRLELARALARDPSVLILDEATASLDPIVEAAIYSNLRRRGCTCLIVAHRISAVRDCDEILVMKGGAVVQRGTHESLTAEGGEYLRLFARAGKPAGTEPG
jgi:NHLM bacteriocin system ABC transporter peptidase/ATP-binding protein